MFSKIKKRPNKIKHVHVVFMTSKFVVGQLTVKISKDVTVTTMSKYIADKTGNDLKDIILLSSHPVSLGG